MLSMVGILKITSQVVIFHPLLTESCMTAPERIVNVHEGGVDDCIVSGALLGERLILKVIARCSNSHYYLIDNII